MARWNRVKVSQYAAALIVATGGIKSTRRMPFLSQKTDAMIFFTEIEVLNFLVLGECVWSHCSDCCLDSGAWWKPHLQSQWSPETHLLPLRSAWETSARNPSVSFPLIFWAPSVCPKFPVTASWIVVLDTSGMMWCNSLIVTSQFARISPSVSWRSL